MISSSQIKFVHSLKLKKFRDLHGCFVAEGSKLVLELADSSFSLKQVYAVEEWIRNHALPSDIHVEPVKPTEMERITGLSSPSPVLAVVGITDEPLAAISWHEDITLALDGIRDPGNLGTIIRIADWFGIGHIICSPGCVDLFNPKVVQATMGSMARVRVNYLDLPGFLATLNRDVPVYGMTLEGEALYGSEIIPNGMIVIGSESDGISESVSKLITHKLSIPFYPSDGTNHAESLNAAVATGIVCAEFRRRKAMRDP